ncbi:MAG: GH3 auxin-responsive promoter [Bacteroidetes bacterium]|nr:MAG: GH3 auxin-responsive promoter [Bacteroidota bacterium]
MRRALARRVFLAWPGGPLRSVERFIAAPEATQEALLRRLLCRASRTAWGRRFGFAELAGRPDVVATYRERVPLHAYEDIRDDVERVRRGAADVFWPGTIRHFAVSSGTASAGKIIPVSEAMLRYNRRYSLASAFHYLTRSGDLRLWGGRFLSVPGSVEEDPRYPGTYVGEVSGLQALYAPAFVRRWYQAIPNEVLFQPSWEKKLDAIVERTVGMDIRAIAMVPSWALVLFRRVIDRYNTLHGTRATTLAEVWPNLQVYFSGGVALRSYRALLQTLIGRPVDFWEHYGASEGFFAFQYDLTSEDLLLHLDNGVYYEFVRMDDPSPSAPRRYALGEVEPGVRYRMYVTTCSGLWAYGVGDVVRFTGRDPYRIVVAGRTSEMLDTYGEAVFGEEARAALEEACARTGARVREFHVTPRPVGVDRLPAHQWLIEFEVPPADLRDFAGALDAYLQRVNRHYQIRREPGAFDPPEVIPLPPGTFHAWLREHHPRLGAQTKVPRMSEERALAEGVLALAGTNPAGFT